MSLKTEDSKTAKAQVADRSIRGEMGRIVQKKEFTVFVAFMVLCVFLAVTSPVFLTMDNMMNVLRQFSTIGILAVGEAMILIVGGMDLSVGSGMGLMGAIMAWMISAGLPWFPVVVITMIAGVLLYGINGLLITRVRINPFIVTLGMLSVYRGATLLLSGGIPIKMLDPTLKLLGKGYLFGIVPVPAVIMIIVAVAGHLFLKKTVWGRNIFAVGNNEKAAKFSGIRTRNVITMAYMIMGGLCALTGMISSATLAAAEPLAGQSKELDVIAAAVIGGVSLSGGEGSILGAILGAALMGVLKNGFILLSVPGYWQTVAVGVVIIAAVALDSIRSQKDS